MIDIFDKEKFAKKVKFFRGNKGYTLLEFSEAADISNSYLSDIETGRSIPSVDVIISILNALETDYETLMNDDGYELSVDSAILNYCKNMTNQEVAFFNRILINIEK